ncbi:MAG: hypothetical protein QNJ05_02845 [Woeseiaceae bacterium]|nr:hypothetical protein [Woeseiaceae bacterium]
MMTQFAETLNAVARELVFPLRVLSVVLQIIVVTLLLSIAVALLSLPPSGFLVLVWIVSAIGILVVLPYLFRSLMDYLECRARDRRPEVAGLERFSVFENTWSLFPIVLAGVAGWGMYRSALVDSAIGSWLILLFGLAILPAVLCVLAITHSPLQSVNPLSLWKLIHRMGPSYAVVPGVAALLLVVYLAFPDVPAFYDILLLLYLAFALFGACGAAIRPFDIIDDIEIAPDESAGEERRRAISDAQREKQLTHAYGFASRGNTAGAVDFLVSASAEEADPIAAREWYFSQMLRWEDNFAALKFAQTIVHEHLAAGYDVAAVKLILRCRLLDPRFAPLSEDLDAAIAAAEACQNPDLAKVLRISR